MIDANQTILDHKIQKIIRSGNLYDLLASKHGVQSPNTYIRGTQTIDYIFGTANVQNSLLHAGMLPFNHGINSDHRELWVDLNIQALFKSNITDIHTRPPQMTTKNVNWTKNARKLITKHIKDTSVRSNLDILLANLY